MASAPPPVGGNGPRQGPPPVPGEPLPSSPAIVQSTPLLTRITTNWKSTASGVLAAAAVVFGVLATSYPAAKWVGVSGAVIAALTGALAKDK